MALHLAVAEGPSLLADALARALGEPPADPFAREVVAVPSDGTRAWLVRRLAERLGASPGGSDGVVANVDFVFPLRLVRRALGDDHVDGSWSVGPLTWAVFDVLHEHGGTLGIRPDAVRCRAVADLFDRYTLHRSAMVARWEAGDDVDAVGAAIPGHLRWQPALWRLLVERLGPARRIDDTALRTLASGTGPPGDLPERVFVVGLAGLPAPHLEVVAALARRIHVHVLAPVTSLPVWRRLWRVTSSPLPSPLPRAEDPTAAAVAHPLSATWARSTRESLLLVAAAARREGVTPVELAAIDGPHRASTALEHLQASLRDDVAPPGAPPDGAPDLRPVVDHDDASIRWHRCHGPARQVEVLRDAVVRLLQERTADGRPRFEPRDVAVLCPDLATFAPLVEAAFAGDPEHGVPEVPLRVADRSLRQDAPLLDAVAALLELLDGRFRATDVLSFAAREPVRRRFRLGADDLGRLVQWVDETNVRWGLHPEGRTAFGLPADLGTHTWRSGIDQLLLGAAMADGEPRVGIGATVPHRGIEGDELDVVGRVAELLHQLERASDDLARQQTVAAWCDGVTRAAMALFEVPDAESWQWRDLEHAIESFAADAVVAGTPCPSPVPPRDLAVLFGARLAGRPGRARFATGAVTLSTLTAQRGVPHRVVCLLGLDGELGSAAPITADDLMVLTPCVGDRDPRSEIRAQLLDAIASAGERLIILTTGRDVRTNADVPPAVPVAELLDVLDDTVRPAADDDAARVSELLSVQHPRHAWSRDNFVPGRLREPGAWSFDRGALAAASARAEQRRRPPFVASPLPDDPTHEVPLADLARALRSPVEALLEVRLGARLRSGDEPVEDLVPLELVGLDGWSLASDLLRSRLAATTPWDDAAREAWDEVQRCAGRVPPLAFGRTELDDCHALVDALLGSWREACGDAAAAAPATVLVDVTVRDIDGRPRRIVGDVPDVRGHVVSVLTPSRAKPDQLLTPWVQLAALATQAPERPWEAVVVSKQETGSKPFCRRLRLQSSDEAARVLATALDTYDRARCSVVPFFPATSWAVFHGKLGAAVGKWASSGMGIGEGERPAVRFTIGRTELDVLLEDPPLDHERGGPWSDAPSRIERWAHRVWGTFHDTVDVDELRPASSRRAPRSTA